MIVIPAIDIKNGNCVRLIQGDPDQETIYSNQPVDMALKFQDYGAELIHVVDLDGAFQNKPVNFDTVKAIAKAVSVPIEIGGGIRTPETIQHYIDAGINRIILGTVLLDDIFDNIIAQFPKYIIAGVDTKNSRVATHGWKEVSSIDALPFIKTLQEKGITECIFTDISTDGMLTGPNKTSMEQILDNTDNLSLIASGGISTTDDIFSLAELKNKGLKGCIVGKAIYDGRIALDTAFKLFV